MEAVVDVAVIGAGPGGIAAAITALRRGCSVVCVDKAAFPRDKTCGDGLTTGALRDLEALGPTKAEFLAVGAAEVRETVLVSPSGRRVTMPLPADDGLYAVVAPRAGSRCGPRRRSPAAPASTSGRTPRSRSVALHDAEVELLCSDGSSVRARHVIAADGHWSHVRRARSSPTRRATSANGTRCASTSPT